MLIKGELRYIQILKDRGTCIDDRLDEIEEQLIRGDKFEQMWEKLEKEWGRITTYYRGRLPNGRYTGHDESIKEIMDRVKQKYFPKPTKKIITIEIEGETEDISKFESRLNRVVGQIIFGVRTNMKGGLL